MRERNMSASTYAEHYNDKWKQLMKKEGRFPLKEYGDRSVLTTWAMSYEQVQKQSEEAARLVKLWGLLASGELWYELVAAASEVASEMNVPAWLLELADDKLEFDDAAGLLVRYSLAESIEGSDGYSMHAVLHRWCGQLAEEEEQQELGCLAAGLVALSVPLQSDTEFWKKRKRIMAHGLRVSGWIDEDSGLGKERVIEASVRPGHFHNLGYLLDDEDRQRAEKMYQRALQGYEKAWGPEHTSTLDTVNNLGILYKELGRLDEAEKMYQRALDGYAQAFNSDVLITYIPALNNMLGFASLRGSQGRVEDARYWYSQALVGYEKTFGPDHDKCESLRTELAFLARRGEEQSVFTNTGSIENSSKENAAKSVTSMIKPASYRHRLVARIRRKQKQG
jgi:tetratricopeptide (TPR) repeat protein